MKKSKISNNQNILSSTFKFNQFFKNKIVDLVKQRDLTIIFVFFGSFGKSDLDPFKNKVRIPLQVLSTANI